MTTPTLIEMAERCEAASGVLVGERTQALLIEAHALIDPAPRVSRVARQANGAPWPGDGIGPYTDEYREWERRANTFRGYLKAGASLDAAMTLVPEGLEFGCGSRDGTDRAWAWVGEAPAIVYEDGSPLKMSNAATPALALTAACLRARASQGGE